MIRRSAAVVLLFTSLSMRAAEPAMLQLTTNHGTNETRELRAAPPSAVIVEFVRPDASRTAASVAAEDFFSRFRADIQRITPRAAASRAGAAARSAIRHEYRHVFFGVAAEIDDASLAKVRALPYVRAVHRDRLMSKSVVAETPAEPAIVDAAKRVNASALPTRGKGVVVAVIDTGIDYKHAAFGGRFGSGAKVASGWDFVGNDADPLDTEGHGTHVAAIIAADGGGLLGVAPEATLHAYKVLDEFGNSPTSRVIAAIERAVDPNGDGNSSDHVDVINLSLGGPGHADDPGAQAVDNAVAAGVIVITAAGNSGRSMSIDSPGAARRAITVGATNDRNEIAYFSAKGPSAKTLGFKPDVVAPGELIVSAQVGGGTAAASGTSMAAPHVAGVAALLKSLHPSWTAADVKSALAATAVPVNGENVWASGAGKIDAAAAANAAIFISDTGLSFGLDAARDGTWDQSRVLRVTNRSSRSETLTATLGALPPGLTVTVTPGQLTLPAGSSADVTLRVVANNPALGYPKSLSVSGSVTFAGTSSLTLPWAFVRAARATVQYDRPFNGTETITIFGRDQVHHAFASAESVADAILPSGQYDIVMQSLHSSDADDEMEAMYIVLAENVTIDGENTIEMKRDAAVRHYSMSALDHEGQPLAALERVPELRSHTAAVRYNFVKNENGHLMDATAMVRTPSLTDVYVTPPRGNFSLVMSEGYVDAHNRRAYAVTFPKVTDFSADHAFTSAPSDYVHATVRVRHPSDFTARRLLGACVATSDTRQFGTNAVMSGCVVADVEENAGFEVFATPDTTIDSHTAIVVTNALSQTEPLRAFGGTLVPTKERTVSPRDVRIPNHGELTLGVGPYHPMAFFGTIGAQFVIFPAIGMHGPWNEYVSFASTGGSFEMFDDKGAYVTGGTVERGTRPPAAKPGYRFELVQDRLSSSARRARGAISVQFGKDLTDLIAPGISSLSVRDAADVPADTFAPGAAATLAFSAADFDYGVFPLLEKWDTKTARASFRVSGTADWQQLTLTHSGSDYEERSKSGHWPAGDFFRADMSAATAVPNVFIDVRIEITDPSGNRLTWTHERALEVGNAKAPAAPRRRSTR